MALDDLGKLNAGYKLNIYFETNFDRRKSKKTEKRQNPTFSIILNVPQWNFADNLPQFPTSEKSSYMCHLLKKMGQM